MARSARRAEDDPALDYVRRVEHRSGRFSKRSRPKAASVDATVHTHGVRAFAESDSFRPVQARLNSAKHVHRAGLIGRASHRAFLDPTATGCPSGHNLSRADTYALKSCTLSAILRRRPCRRYETWKRYKTPAVFARRQVRTQKERGRMFSTSLFSGLLKPGSDLLSHQRQYHRRRRLND